MSSRLQHPTCYKFRHYRGDGLLLWGSGVGDVAHHGIQRGSRLERELWGDQAWQDNALFDEGEQNILNAYFRANAVPAGFYFRLYNDTIQESDSLSTLQGEVTGSGYDGLSVARNTTDWGAPTTDVSGYKTTSATKTFTASSTGSAWSAANNMVLATVQNGTSGLAIAWVALSQTRALGLDDTLAVDLAAKLD